MRALVSSVRFPWALAELRLLASGDDVVGERGDMAPALYQFLLGLHILPNRDLLRRKPDQRTDATMSQSWDITWDGASIA